MISSPTVLSKYGWEMCAVAMKVKADWRDSNKQMTTNESFLSSELVVLELLLLLQKDYRGLQDLRSSLTKPWLIMFWVKLNTCQMVASFPLSGAISPRDITLISALLKEVGQFQANKWKESVETLIWAIHERTLREVTGNIKPGLEIIYCIFI